MARKRGIGLKPSTDAIDRLIETKSDRIEDVIQRHLRGNVFDDEGEVSPGLVFAIVQADLAALEENGFSNDAEKLKEIQRSLRVIQRLLSELEANTVSDLDWTYEYNRHKGWTSVVERVTAELDSFQTSVSDLRKQPAYNTSPKGRRNWRAANVAKEARVTWAIAHWDGPVPPVEDPGRTAYNEHLARFSPVSDKQDAPGPFGRFLEDLFVALDICKPDGEPVSAQSALRSMKDL